MKICVCGLWHLGLVTAGCVAATFETAAFDFDAALVEEIAAGTLPVFEPGLEQLIAAGVARGRLRLSSDLSEAVSGADVVWIAWDTPVDDSDVADVDFVADRIRRIVPFVKKGALLLISSQVPIGFSRGIVSECAALGRSDVGVAYSPENLQLGRAIEAFEHPGRVVLGRSDPEDRRAAEIFGTFSADLLEMSLESAEMSKHALNAFLATSLSFANEIAALCERFGADMRDVSNALRTDPRIGPRAYLSPGPGFAGGTLARDVGSLENAAAASDLALPLLGAIRASNLQNQVWAEHKLRELAVPANAVIALLGLTYKPGTDTLRRSGAVELAQKLAARGALLHAYDPAIARLPADLEETIDLRSSVDDALVGADVAIISTEWPQFAHIPAESFAVRMRSPVVIDARRILEDGTAADPRLSYHAIGLGKAPARW